MFLLVNKATKLILLSSARPLDSTHYTDEVYIVDIPDNQYSPEMVGGVLHDDD